MLLLSIFSLSLIGQENNNVQKTYVLEYFNNTCLIEVIPGSGNIDLSCNEQNYPEENPNDTNMRYKVPPDGNKQTWAVYEIQTDGSKKMVQHFLLHDSEKKKSNKKHRNLETCKVANLPPMRGGGEAAAPFWDEIVRLCRFLGL